MLFCAYASFKTLSHFCSWAKAAPDEKKGLDASWAASLSTVKKITEEVLTLSAASSAAFAVSGYAYVLLGLSLQLQLHVQQV